MVSINKFVLELDDENWLTDLAFLLDLNAHLNKLYMHLQGENQLVKYHVSNHNSISNESEMMACSI